MQLEDPRGARYRPLQNERCSNESIAMHVSLKIKLRTQGNI